MFEWDENKRVKTLQERSLDFRDARLIFDGRPVVHIPAFKNDEARFVSVALIGPKFFSVVWTWRSERRRIISFRRREMAMKKRIVKYTAEELAELVKREGNGTAWQKAEAMTAAEIEASVAADSAEAGMVMDWDNVTVEMPKPKAVLNMRVDQDILDYFRKTGKGYQTRINAILRSYVEQKEQRQHD